MDVGLARLETARRRVASRAVRALSKDASSHGFAMAALLTAMSIMAIALAAALPAWQQMMQREKEEELGLAGAVGRRRVAVAAEPTHRLRMSQEVRFSTVCAAAQDGAADSEARPVLPEGRHTAAPDGRETGR